MSESQKINVEQLFEFLAKHIGQQHQHQWAIMSISPERDGPAMHPRLAQRPHTLVLLKCHCGMPTTLSLDGVWTMTQLMQEIGEHNATTQTRSTPTEVDTGPSGEYPPTE